MECDCNDDDMVILVAVMQQSARYVLQSQGRVYCLTHGAALKYWDHANNE
jgi:hypothetical protein